jgi:hypothetical protein
VNYPARLKTACADLRFVRHGRLNACSMAVCFSAPILRLCSSASGRGRALAVRSSRLSINRRPQTANRHLVNVRNTLRTGRWRGNGSCASMTGMPPTPEVRGLRSMDSNRCRADDRRDGHQRPQGVESNRCRELTSCCKAVAPSPYQYGPNSLALDHPHPGGITPGIHRASSRQQSHPSATRVAARTRSSCAHCHP